LDFQKAVNRTQIFNGRGNPGDPIYAIILQSTAMPVSGCDMQSGSLPHEEKKDDEFITRFYLRRKYVYD